MIMHRRASAVHSLSADFPKYHFFGTDEVKMNMDLKIHVRISQALTVYVRIPSVFLSKVGLKEAENSSFILNIFQGFFYT